MRGTIGDFALTTRLDAGRAADVWRGTAPDGATVAVRVAREPIPPGVRVGDAEIRLLARLDHPGIAWLYDHGRTSAGGPYPPGCPYLVAEYCSGGSLADRAIEDWPAAREVLVGLLGALAHAHARGLVHRDLRPANVLWAGSSDARPGMKLADFAVPWAPTGAPGARWYRPPELAPVGPWTDLYALGAIAWELVTGDPPHAGDTPDAVRAAARGGPPRFLPVYVVPEGLETWLRALLDPDPARRPRHAAECLADLGRLDPAIAVPAEDWRQTRAAGPRLRAQSAGLRLIALREPDLAGRDIERDALWSELAEVRARSELRVTVLRGISGIGKSRLCRWLVERAAELGLADSVVVGCRDGGALVQLLGGLLQVPPTPDRVDAIAAALDEPVAARLGPVLRAPSRPWGTLPAVRRLVCQETRQPRILVLDDAQHSMDAIRLARSLRADRPGAPLLVVLTLEEETLAREPELRDQVDGLCDTEGVSTRVVGPLTPAEQDALLDSLVALDPESHSAVLANAGGHPGYVVAQVTSWAGQGALTPSPRGFQLRADRPPAESWPSVWARWMAEWVAGLDVDDQRLLEHAGVLGRAVDEGLWERVCDDPRAEFPADEVRLDLAAARRRAALAERLIAAGLAYDTDVGFTFTHPALVEVLREQARVGGRLAASHRAAANHLRRMPMPDHALPLGYHLSEACAWEEAATALLAGIEFHWRFRDRRPLLTELGRAERCVAAAGWSEDDPRRCDLLHAHALLLVTAGRPDEAVGVARRAHALAARLGDRARMARTLWRIVDALVVVSRWDEASDVLLQFLKVEDARDEDAQAGIARGRVGRCLRARGEAAEAERWFAEAEQHLRAVQPPTTTSLGGLLELYGFMSRNDAILEVGGELERLAFEEGRTDRQLFAMSKQVEACVALARWIPGIELARECLRINTQLGDQRFARYMRVELGVLELRAGRTADALRTLTDVLGILDRQQFTWLAITALELRAEAAVAAHELAAFDRDFEEIEQLVLLGRYERDALAFRLQRLGRQLVDAGYLGRAELVERLTRQVTTKLPTESALG